MTGYGAILLAALSLSAPLSGKALDDKIRACSKILSQKEYETAGNRLIIVKPVNLAHFPRGFLCPKCHGGASMSSIVFEDGSVSLPNFNGTAFFPVDANGLPRIWPMDVLSNRVAQMRFAPPSIDGKSVCVRIEIGWSSISPHKLLWRQAP
jgi:hypothetical protein